jgi:23S rRNA (uracil1939-C5)-methyltransferase
MTDRMTLAIDRLGAQGDGIAETETSPVYVRGALAGETVTADVDGERGALVSVERASPQRQAPICRHFGACGGCDVQHLASGAYLAWKHELVVAALAARGITAQVEPVVAVAPGSRRRVVLAARRMRSGVLIGYHGPASHDIVPVEECPVALPAIVAAIAALPPLLSLLLSRKGEARVTLTAADNGLDADITGASPDLDAVRRMAAADAARVARLARVTVDGEPLFAEAEPFVAFGPAKVVLPPGPFLQATAVSQAAMTALVQEAVGDGRRIADLFAGLGAFTFPLARTMEVLAVEWDKRSVEAMKDAVRRTQGIRRIDVIRRDLFREPFAGKELERLDAVVLDPPRAGAKAQAETLASSKVPLLAYVSCNPATLARDLRILVDGGYRITRITPIDQFLFAAHVEVVVALER